MKENYRPWNIAFQNTSQMSDVELLRHLLDFAVLAPSSHNSQPWIFAVNKNAIEISANTNRRLKESDNNDRQLFISLGCAIETILIAADYYGCEMNKETKKIDDTYTTIITIQNRSVAKASTDHLAHAINNRVTNRSKYQQASVEETLIHQLQSIANVYGVESNRINSNHPHRQEVIDIVMDATNEAMASNAFRKELSQYLLPNTSSKPVGMPCSGMYIPTPVSFIAPTMIRLFNMGKITGKEERKILEHHTPEFVFLSHEKDTPESWMQAGRALQNIWLTATKHGYAVNPLAAPIQIGDYYKKVQSLFNYTKRPLIFFRLGKATKTAKHSPRLAPERVLK